MKRLMLLGGSLYLTPVIEAAHRLGVYVITCDYLPENGAHRLSDEYCNVSVMDKEKILSVAKEKQINGIVSFACDPGVVTAAYVAEQMRIPFQCSYKSACILQDKGLFREFLKENDFHCPEAKRYTDKREALADAVNFRWPIIVKPTDSAGSKGVTRVDKPEKLAAAVDDALKESHNNAFLIEEFLTFEGFHSSADAFTVDGKLEFITYSDQLFDEKADNPYTPAYIIWPSSMKESHQEYLTKEIQRLMDLLGMKNGIYNIETCVGSDGKPYIMEVSPRGGGCRIAEIQKLAMGVDLIEMEVRSALGMQLPAIRWHLTDGHWCEMVVHAQNGQSGILKEIMIDEEYRQKFVKKEMLTVKAGDIVKPFTGANTSLGDIFLKFPSREKLDESREKVEAWLHIECLAESNLIETES